jgi:zinc protease
VDLTIHVRVDDKQEPPAQFGLHDAAFALMTTAGGAQHDATWIEEEIAFLGASLDSYADENGGVLGLQTLTKDLPHGLDLAFELLRSPRYQEDRLQQWKDRRLAAFRKRNDEAEDVERAQWRRLVYDERSNRPGTAATTAAIDAASLKAWHDRWVQPRNLLITVSGDITAKEILPQLEKRFKGWSGPAQDFGSPDPCYADARPGVYLVNKAINQTRARCILPGLDRDDPRWLPAWLMNEMLGGGSMSSKLLNRIRTQEGLAYSVGSRLEERDFGRGLLFAAFQTKVESTQYAMSLLREELGKMAAGDFRDEELENSKAQLVQAFPTWFVSAGAIAGVLAGEELSGRDKSDPRHYQELRTRVQAVTRQQVEEAARDLLKPGAMVWLLVGDAPKILAPDTEHGLKLEDFGPVTRLPLRDPLTLEALPLD